MLVLFPMNGTGERFKEAGFKDWKPLIYVDEQPLIEKVLACYEGLTKIAFTREEFIPRIDNFFDMIVPCKTETRGPLETIISGTKATHEGLGNINIHSEVLIADCDSLIDKSELYEALTHFRNVEADGGVTVMRSSNPNYSYAQLKGFDVLETREKDPFTNWTTTGPYYFKSWKIMMDALLQTARKDIYSISPSYNHLISQGKRVVAYPVEKFKHLGSPEELKCFQS